MPGSYDLSDKDLYQGRGERRAVWSVLTANQVFQREASGRSRSESREVTVNKSRGLTQTAVNAVGRRGGISPFGSKVPPKIPPYQFDRES